MQNKTQMIVAAIIIEIILFVLAFAAGYVKGEHDTVERLIKNKQQ